MATTIVMPQLGETVTEGTVAQWLKRPGDAIEKYEAFVEVSTDKVNAEVPSPVAGVLRELIVKEGETVPTGAPIAIIEESGALLARHAEPLAGHGDQRHDILRQAQDDTTCHPEPVEGLGAERKATNGRSGANGLRHSPAVRRLAREHAIDLARVIGTGTHGRVTADDVVAAASSLAAPAPKPPLMPTPTVAPSVAPIPAATGAAPRTDSEHRPLTPARRLIAQRMVESKRTAPHAWTMVEVDVTNLWKWRAAAKDAFERGTGVKLTLLPFFIHAVAQSLRSFPLMNASFHDDGIAVHRHVHVGIATATDGNLVVPVIRDTDRLSIRGIALAAGSIIERARGGKLTVDELSGGTFTVNNNGANGSVLSAPILVTGQAGIVTMEAVVKRPVVRDDDAIVIRSMMNMCLSLDHRVIDGAVADGFLVDVKQRLEALGPTGTL